MIPNLTSIIMIIATAPMLILLMFLPAFIELRALMLFVTRFCPIANMEDEQKFDSSLIQKMAKIVDVLPSLEV
jgi:hypothetical protein